MSKMSRNKGANGEREVSRMLEKSLGLDSGSLTRNLDQTRDGGSDILGFRDCSIEVKRCEKLSIPSWWGQTCTQAGDTEWPVLFYRQSRKPWTVIVRLDMIYAYQEYGDEAYAGMFSLHHSFRAEISYDTFITMLTGKLKRSK